MKHETDEKEGKKRRRQEREEARAAIRAELEKKAGKDADGEQVLSANIRRI